MHMRRLVCLLVLLVWSAGGLAWSQEPPAQTEEQGSAQGTETTTDSGGQSTMQEQNPTPETTGRSVTRLQEFTVTRRRPTSAASSETIRARDYELRPHTTTQEILNNVPGLVVAQHQGGGKAPQYFLRGFDADHGTDVAVFVDGLPVNLVSHAHGQGYADLNFVMENSVQALGGYFNTTRYAVAASPRFGPVKTLLAAEVYYSDGPFLSPARYGRYNLFSKFTWEPTPESKLSFWASHYGGDWHGSGQIPLREVHAGRLDRFSAIDPSEGGRTDRQNLNLIYTYTPSAQENWLVQLYGSRYKLNLFNNFTFFKDDPVRGDGINQNDQRYLYGGRVRYARIWSLGSLLTQSTIGVETRNDEANVGLFHQQRRRRFATTTKVHVSEHSLGGYWQQEFFLTAWARLQLGLRGDEFFFDVGNRLPATATDAMRIRGVTNDGLVNPKANLILSPFRKVASLWRNTEFFLNFGMGYHSNDARDAVQAGGKPLARSTGGEIGARTNLWDRLDLAAALWILDLNGKGYSPRAHAPHEWWPHRTIQRWVLRCPTPAVSGRSASQ